MQIIAQENSGDFLQGEKLFGSNAEGDLLGGIFSQEMGQFDGVESDAVQFVVAESKAVQAIEIADLVNPDLVGGLPFVLAEIADGDVRPAAGVF